MFLFSERLRGQNTVSLLPTVYIIHQILRYITSSRSEKGLDRLHAIGCLNLCLYVVSIHGNHMCMAGPTLMHLCHRVYLCWQTWGCIICMQSCQGSLKRGRFVPSRSNLRFAFRHFISIKLHTSNYRWFEDMLEVAAILRSKHCTSIQLWTRQFDQALTARTAKIFIFCHGWMRPS